MSDRLPVHGEQLIPLDHVSESTTAYNSRDYYGLHWWVYSEELFVSVGMDGQNIYVYPDEDLVIARFGLYSQIGVETVRDEEWENYHSTVAYGPFDEGDFLEMIRSARTKAP